VDDHRLIAQAIERRDAAAAEEVVRLHLHHAYGVIVAAQTAAAAVAEAPVPAAKPRIAKKKRGSA